MSINLNDLLGDHPWTLWLVLAALLAGARLVVASPWLLRLAAAVLPAALVAALWPTAAAVQLLVAALSVAVVVVVVLLPRWRGRTATSG
ncbi:hypothetical protein [Auraticoccus monumenti]|uniref:Uncharacterized protein n=1 Tax=Auraticoccus monumenti TaxID=675864 RepID=A0A1G7DCD1_9ACTN|nr:hypothetical protein [Auraticoccus monumenti]SDE49173.1 hypothetical protein SAMN04489747_3555 [Auraticoccus monumenti]